MEINLKGTNVTNIYDIVPQRNSLNFIQFLLGSNGKHVFYLLKDIFV